MNPIPETMNLQKYWRNHSVVTDAMVAYFKKSLGCEEYHAVMDVSKHRFRSMFGVSLPKGKRAWMKVDQRNGAMNVFRENIMITDKNGRNPESLEVMLAKEQPKAKYKVGDTVRVSDYPYRGFAMATIMETKRTGSVWVYKIKVKRTGQAEKEELVNEESFY